MTRFIQKNYKEVIKESGNSDLAMLSVMIDVEMKIWEGTGYGCCLEGELLDFDGYCEEQDARYVDNIEHLIMYLNEWDEAKAEGDYEYMEEYGISQEDLADSRYVSYEFVMCNLEDDFLE